ncbi:MAG: 50S ribosomal protein L29 [Nitrospinae bacterium RIFCSPLOWO2_02_FULL_39_110]|nr:MAG: 50S ribosomal protein L29 [Nitrospinae bacterium RIFCSPHIGHO2_02_39_11]OGV99941.1 MAG: 50S ribosomal protein L29 [Nitrospinae bacterium RIFCSPHIGHO2_12_FULL_39_42]OGW02135.1 MAG: 50S ribosomal protein L29 [Nitrospinae bacterium RIFCSPHIGHO2_02_FULL_39_82]OGW02324.1 MAG: 50S ribosomal protein L29 [Nitrospinae bacterium RIFCSPLOWO2_02_39_17]OGW04682.1 MAG: 50S ribosomal protein L29 [Nitrospinae bacterium RIFCSPLOWO2_02_FULL_39_110]OGW09915.1 MAG: 50S ribosomal protein L29 [Nitrospinae ba
MKAKELRDLTKEELLKKLVEIKSELLNLRFQAAMKTIENPIRLRILKKDVARINTILTEKELKD